MQDPGTIAKNKDMILPNGLVNLLGMEFLEL